MWIFIILLITAGSVSLISLAMMWNGQHSHRQILIDLGLESGISGKVQAPFYKWGWRKQSAERVWAENIVKEAFRRANIWLSAEDLAYFERACKLHAEGKSPSEEKLKNRIRSITERMDALRATVAAHVREVMQRILSTSLKDAQTVLDAKGIHVDEHQVMSRFGSYFLRQKLASLGNLVLGFDAKGVPIENAQHDTVHHMRGMSSWKTLLELFIDEAAKQAGKNTRSAKASAFLSLERQINEGVLKDYVDDVHEYQKFIELLEKEIKEKEFNLELTDLERIESILYTWRFTEGVPVNMVDHKRIRKLLCNRELASRFREIVLSGIQLDFKSAKQIFDLFPKSVIFHGKSKDARTFAAEIYQIHLRRLYEAFAPCFGMDTEEPAMLKIPTTDFTQLMKAESGKAASLEKFAAFKGVSKKEDRFDIDKLTLLLQKHKRLLNRERNLTEEISEKKGWITHIPVSDEYPEAFTLFETPPYHRYIRFNCDSAGPIDFKNRTYQARKQREIFFNLILDMLTNNANLNAGSNGNQLKPVTPLQTPDAMAV